MWNPFTQEFAGLRRLLFALEGASVSFLRFKLVCDSSRDRNDVKTLVWKMYNLPNEVMAGIEQQMTPTLASMKLLLTLRLTNC